MRHEISDKTIVYEPNQRVKLGFLKSWIFMMANIIRSRELIWQLFKRDFMSGYKQSFLGIFWIFLSPVVGIISWVFMNSTGILNPGDVGVPYPIYVLLGNTLWGLFLSFYSSTAGSLSSGSALILQINFSHEALVAQQIAQTIANFIISFFMTLIMLLIFKVMPGWQAVFFPLMLIPIFFVGTGIGMVVAVITVVAHDINRIVSMGLGFLIFLTPVIYSPKIQNNLLQTIIKWNPMTYLVCGARDIILYGKIGSPVGYMISCTLALILFMLSWRLFFLSEYKVAEKL